MKKKTYWYQKYIGTCPICGCTKGYRKRVYGPKPKNPADRCYRMEDLFESEDIAYQNRIVGKAP
jgi:hypothetical protein